MVDQHHHHGNPAGYVEGGPHYPGMPRLDNRKCTAAFLTPMIVGGGVGVGMNQSDLIPEAYTLQFSFVGVENDNAGNPFIPTAQAIVTWKIDGQQQRRVISIVSGASISGVCNAIDVRIVDIPNGGDNTAGKKYSVQSTLSRGLRANTQQPPTLTDQLLQGIGTGSSATWNVPQDAGVTSIFVLLAAGTTGAIDPGSVIVDTSDTTTPSPALLGAYYPLMAQKWVPLPPGSQRVVVHNGHTDTVFTQVIWGIDG